jgi:hypothetical protein
LSDDSAEQIREAIGQPSENLEQIEIYKNVIFWTFDINKYQKCNWWKRTAENGIAEKLTIRTASTLKKKITAIDCAISSSSASITGAVAAMAEPPQIDDPTPTSIAVFVCTLSNRCSIQAITRDVVIVHTIIGNDCFPV